jgi:hypothetical protein
VIKFREFLSIGDLFDYKYSSQILFLNSTLKVTALMRIVLLQAECQGIQDHM